MANGKIRVRLRAFDVELIDQSAKAIVQAVQKAGLLWWIDKGW